MAQSILKVLLSGSTNGRAISVVQTSDSGTLIHTCSSSTSDIDEIWLYAYNSSAAAVLLTIELGSNAASDLISVSIPSQAGLYTVLPGITIAGAVSPLLVRAYAATGSVITICGFVNRLTQT